MIIICYVMFFQDLFTFVWEGLLCNRNSTNASSTSWYVSSWLSFGKLLSLLLLFSSDHCYCYLCCCCCCYLLLVLLLLLLLLLLLVIGIVVAVVASSLFFLLLLLLRVLLLLLLLLLTLFSSVQNFSSLYRSVIQQIILQLSLIHI